MWQPKQIQNKKFVWKYHSILENFEAVKQAELLQIKEASPSHTHNLLTDNVLPFISPSLNLSAEIAYQPSHKACPYFVFSDLIFYNQQATMTLFMHNYVWV